MRERLIRGKIKTEALLRWRKECIKVKYLIPTRGLWSMHEILRRSVRLSGKADKTGKQSRQRSGLFCIFLLSRVNKVSQEYGTIVIKS